MNVTYGRGPNWMIYSQRLKRNVTKLLKAMPMTVMAEETHKRYNAYEEGNLDSCDHCP